MQGWSGFIKLWAIAFSGALLAGCTTLSLGLGTGIYALDYLNDDVASMIMAVDVPVSLVPVPGESLVVFGVIPASGRPRQVVARLERADAAELAATLPPPSQGRGYFLFEFSEEDRVEFRKFQNWMHRVSTEENVGRSRYKVEFIPVFCTLTPIDPAETTYAVQVILPGAGPREPLVAEETLADLLGRHDTMRIPLCSAGE